MKLKIPCSTITLALLAVAPLALVGCGAPCKGQECADIAALSEPLVLCASIGLSLYARSATLKSCVTGSTRAPANLWVYPWTNPAAWEVNKQVNHMGARQIPDASGWILTPRNRCSR